MHITRVLVQNYRCLREADLILNPDLNIIVGENECGKSTLLEAVNLALSGQLNGRQLQSELHPHLFNIGVVAEYIGAIRSKKPAAPPSISIELYLADEPTLAKLKGTNNSLRLDVPGVRLTVFEYEGHVPRRNLHCSAGRRGCLCRQARHADFTVRPQN